VRDRADLTVDHEIVAHGQAGDTAEVLVDETSLVVEALLENLPGRSAANERGGGRDAAGEHRDELA
jgi:hypothetical protein